MKDDVPAPPARRSPLHERHLALGAKTADFSGWEMPIEYAGGGVLAEHAAVRSSVGLFDVSHLGKAEVSGTSTTGLSARAFLDSCLANDLSRIEPGRAQYTLCCNESGGVVDDLIAYLRADDDVLLVPNAANTAAVVELLAAAAPEGIAAENAHDRYGVLAVQGPSSPAVLEAVGLPTGHRYMGFVETSFEGAPVVVCRTGYTGEQGYELLPRWQDAGMLWDALHAAVVQEQGRACGLGARDTLRTEMGYALHGHELSTSISPIQARLGWAVGWGKPAFWGREALVAEKEAGPALVARGLLALGRGVPRADLPVRAGGAEVGRTTSGTFSPTLKQGIALALLAPSVAVGDEVMIDVRGRELQCRVVKLPFVSTSTS